MIERPLVTVGGLIVAPDGEIFLTRSNKWPGLYSLPGGKVELGETRKEAFIREVMEETGLKIVNIRFCMIQECIFSEEYWQKKHFVMNDFIADLDPSCSKNQVRLNEEAQSFIWISPLEALKLPLQRECRALIEKCFEKKSLCFLGIQQYQIPCIIGVNPHERLLEQTICIDAKIKVDLSSALISRDLKDSVDYVLIAKLCNELARQNKYFLLEILASDILDEALKRFEAVWAWVRIQKPAAIPNAACAFVEMERYRDKISKEG